MATDAEKVKMYREKAKDTSVPQEVRNTYLDRANELERKAYEATKGAPPAKLALGGMPMVNPQRNPNRKMAAPTAAVAAPAVSSKMATPKMAILTKTPGAKASASRSLKPTMMAKGGAVKAPAVKMNKGGYANCGASMAPSQKGKK
jgi:hypothetical protein